MDMSELVDRAYLELRLATGHRLSRRDAERLESLRERLELAARIAESQDRDQRLWDQLALFGEE